VLLVFELGWGKNAHFHVVAFHGEGVFDSVVPNTVVLENFISSVDVHSYQ
jgi:hypothetical protein